MNPSSINTYNRLLVKSEDWDARIPSITSIHKMLEDLQIDHEFRTSVNIVEYRSKGRNYVNSRHNGKKGYKLEIEVPDDAYEMVNCNTISLDTSDSYYSANGTHYARKIINLIKYYNKQP